MTDQPPGGTASRAEAARFPRLARPSPAALVAGAGAAVVLVGPLGAIVALPVAAAARDAYADIFRRAAGLEPNPSFRADTAGAPGASPDLNRHHEESVASAAAGGTS